MSHLSVFDLFKIGLGPSSSHTVGPMKASHEFLSDLIDRQLIANTSTITIALYGSLSATGIGHGTDKATLLGLMGYLPDSIDPDYLTEAYQTIKQDNQLTLAEHSDNEKTIAFNVTEHIIFDDTALDYHPNAMTLSAYDDATNTLYENTYYSIGGGFVVNQQHTNSDSLITEDTASPPYPFNTANQLMKLCEQHRLSVAELMMQNELTWRNKQDIEKQLLAIWHAMDASIDRGFKTKGILPGGLDVKRRAPELHQSIVSRQCDNIIASSMGGMEWVNLYAMAVNEENAAGGRIVTAPTNGAAGIVPAVLSFYIRFNKDSCENDAINFLLAAAAVGILCKKNASISGAEVGCQGEVGSASAMAAAGLAEVMGASIWQLENAAEIALEHNLGLTCDPIGGLVQIPCIERNAVASVKAINAVQIALHGDGKHHVSLDKVIITMRETGRDMMAKYKETSQGGLAVNYVEC